MRGAALAVLLIAAPALADSGPTIPAGSVFVQLNLEASVTKDKVLAPFSIAPDLSVGVSRDVQLSLIHSGSALTGFRGTSGNGVCVTGTSNGCPNVYEDGGLEALFALARGSFSMAADVGLLWTYTNPLELDAKLGVKTKSTVGPVSFVFQPSVWVPVSDKDDTNVPHNTQAWLPAALWFKLSPALQLGASSGIKGPPGHMTSRYAVPLGVLGQYTVSPRFGIGASLVFGKVWAGSAIPDPGFDARSVQVWLNVTP